MSAKLLKRMLQETADAEVEEAEASRSKKKESEKKTRRGKSGKQEDDSPTAAMDDIIQYQINGMLLLDQKMVSTSSKVGESLARIKRKNDKQSRIRKESTSIAIGNSRDASSKAMKVKHLPTFNKKRYKAQQEKKKIAAIAKLLNKKAKKKSNNMN